MSRYQPAPEPDPFPSHPPRRRISVRVAARTDRGLERPNNEDRAAFADLGSSVAFEPPAAAMLVPEVGAFVGLVCDGMGGEAGGEIASSLAVETIVPFLRSVCLGGATDGHVARGLVASIEAASARIKEEGRRQPRYSRMGTTATLAAVADRSLVCAQVGDSRAYLARAGTLTQLTHDQTMAELLRKSGAVPTAGGFGNPARVPVEKEDIHEIVGSNVILQAVGSSVRLDVAITHTPLEDGDTILLCSDGLTGVVSDDVIANVLAQNEDPDHACDLLVRHALEGGAPDNVTCVVFRVGAGRVRK